MYKNCILIPIQMGISLLQYPFESEAGLRCRIGTYLSTPNMSGSATLTYAHLINELTTYRTNNPCVVQILHLTVPDTASYIRGWIQIVLAPNDLFSWNNKYNKYNEYNIADTFTCIFLARHTTYYVHAGILKPWRGRLPWLHVVFSSYHDVFSLPLSGLNWRSLFPPWGSGPPFPKMAPPFTGPAHTPLPGSGTLTM
jgi:hypothetical protein